MPFSDKEWEDSQRDSATFPAYTDYIFGIDTRAQVAQEPGLHPQIYPPSVPDGYAVAAATPPSAQHHNVSTPDTTNSQRTLYRPSPPVFFSNGGVDQQAGIKSQSES
jgi:hypothetical protein